MFRIRFQQSPQFYLVSVALMCHLLSMVFMTDLILMGDAKQFNDEAMNIVSGNGWINTEGPGNATTTYPTLVIYLVVCKLLFGVHNYFFPILFQHLMAISAAVILYSTCRLIGLPRVVSLIAELIILTFPKMYQSANCLNTATLAYFLPILFLYLCINFKAFLLAALAGFTMGLAILARFTYQYVPIGLVFCAIRFKNSNDYPHLLKGKRFFVVLFTCAITILPWFCWISINDGGNTGYSDAWDMIYKFNSTPDREFAYVDSLRTSIKSSELTKAEQEVLFRQMTFDLLVENPEFFIKNIMTNTTAMFVHITWMKCNMISPFLAIYHSILLGYGIFGVMLLRKSANTKMMPLYAFVFITYFIHAIGYGWFEHFYVFWIAFAPSSAMGISTFITVIKKSQAHTLSTQ